MAATVNARDVVCPVCEALPGRRCTGTRSGSLPWGESHPARVRMSERINAAAPADTTDDDSSEVRVR